MDGTLRVTMAAEAAGGVGMLRARPAHRRRILDQAAAPPTAHGPRRLHLGPARQPHLQSPRLPPTTHLCERPWKTHMVTSRTPARSRPRERAALSRGRGGFPVGHAPSGPSCPLPPGQACTALFNCRHLSACAQQPSKFREGRAPPGDCQRLNPGTSAPPGQPAACRLAQGGTAQPGPAQPTSARLGCLRLSQNV